MKVLWFSNTPANGVSDKSKGTGSWLVPLNVAIQEFVDLHITYPYPYKKMAYKNEKTSYYPLYTGNILISKLKELYLNEVHDETFLEQYLTIVNHVQPDIIHIHGTEYPFACLIPYVNVPVIVSIQGNITVYYNKYKSGLGDKYIHTQKWTTNLKNLFLSSNFYKNYKQREYKSKVELKQLRNARYIIGRTDWDRRITSVMSPDSKYYIGDEMLRDSFHNNEWKQRTQTNTIKVFTINGDSYFKGFETLCHGLSILTQYGFDVEWTVAGVNNHSLIYKIARKYLGKNFPTKGLTLLGSVTEDMLVKHMLSSDIYVMPSHIENSPNNLCEAMLLGMPCIATVAGGTASLLMDKKEGILIQDGDAWVLAGSILELHNNPMQAAEMGRCARQRALIRHDKTRIVNQLLETYKTIISENR